MTDNEDKNKTRVFVSEADIEEQANKNGGLTFEQKLLIDTNRKLADAATKAEIAELKAYNEKQDLLVRVIQKTQENCVVNSAQNIWKVLGKKFIVGACLGGGGFYGLKELIEYIFTIL